MTAPAVTPRPDVALGVTRAELARAREQIARLNRQVAAEQARRREAEGVADAVVEVVYRARVVTTGDRPWRATLDQLKDDLDRELLRIGHAR